MKRWLVLAAFLLAGCGGGASAPSVPTIPTAPPVTAPTSTLAFQANFTGPSIGLTDYCSGDVPVACPTLAPSGMIWGTFSAPAGIGGAVLDPGPNPYYAASDGVLSLNAPSGEAWPIISVQTFPASSTLVFKATILAHVLDTTGWGGLVAYNGDALPGQAQSTGNWRAMYYDAWTQAGYVAVSVWGPTHIQSFPALYFPQNTLHQFEMDYAPGGTWTYKLDGNVIGTETPGSWSADSTVFSNDPHVAIFLGAMQMQVTSLSVSTMP